MVDLGTNLFRSCEQLEGFMTVISGIDGGHACKQGCLWEHTAVRNASCKRLKSTVCFYQRTRFYYSGSMWQVSVVTGCAFAVSNDIMMSNSHSSSRAVLSPSDSCNNHEVSAHEFYFMLCFVFTSIILPGLGNIAPPCY